MGDSTPRYKIAAKNLPVQVRAQVRMANQALRIASQCLALAMLDDALHEARAHRIRNIVDHLQRRITDCSNDIETLTANPAFTADKDLT